MDHAAFHSLWDATAEPAGAFQALKGPRRVDVAIVGGGYTGLSAALHLAERGARVGLLEAEEPGWGASGRNGGQVIPGIKYDPPEILAKFGPVLGPRLTEFVGETANFTFDLIDRLGIRCDARRCGWIQCAHNEAMAGALRRRAESWSGLGADVEILDRNGIADALGTDAYVGGWLDRRGGGLHPLSYARGLARAASAAGASIWTRSPATALAEAPGGYRVLTDRGVLEAEQVILATNGYSGPLHPKVARTVIPAHSFQVATAPLDEATRNAILPRGTVASDSRRVLLYFRLGPQGRLIMGGVGSVGAPSGPRSFRHLDKAIARLFPLVKAELQHHWYGKVAITMDFLPHLHEVSPGLHSALGYNGRGVALATAMGSLLARRVMGEPATSLPFPTTSISPVPFYRLRNLYVAAARTYYRLRD